MVSVFDVAKYILEKKGQVSAMKLQKLVYYAQAWSLVWDEEALFDSRIEAWANGPVCRELYTEHRRQFLLNAQSFESGCSDNLREYQKDTINAVLRDYGNKTAQQLSDLTHVENPWRLARGNTPDGASSFEEIDLLSMHEYYSGLQPNDDEQKVTLPQQA